MKMTLLHLTCTNMEEADNIAHVLIEKRLIVCAEKSSITSSFMWKGKIEGGSEVLLVMETDEVLFEEIETEVRKIHSYDTFVLLATPVSKSSKGVKEWMEESLKKIEEK